MHNIQTHLGEKDILYAYTQGDQVYYIGKTVRPFKQRLYNYQHPGQSMRTSIRVRQLIFDELTQGRTVDIYILVTTQKIEYQGIQLNLAAGLEDPLIALFQPAWNIVGKR